jgi:hypothetical protein
MVSLSRLTAGAPLPGESVAFHKPVFIDSLMAKKSSGGVRFEHLVIVFAASVLWLIAQDLAKAEGESWLKRQGLWPR